MFNIIHISIVTLILLFILVKCDIPNFRYFIMFVILCGQLFFVYNEYLYNQTHLFELYEEPVSNVPTNTSTNTTANAPIVPKELECCHAVDVAKISKLKDIPNLVKSNINVGIQELIDTSKDDDDYALLAPQNTKYTDETVRKQYKHIDYLLAKIKAFDKDIYNLIVPTYINSDFDKMQQDDNSKTIGKPPPPCSNDITNDGNNE